MPKVKKVQRTSGVSIDWNSSELSTMIEAADADFTVSVFDPRFQKPVVRRYVKIERNEAAWKRSIAAEIHNEASACAKLLRVYQSVVLDEETYATKIRPLRSYWSLNPSFEDDTAIVTGSGRSITEAFQVLGALCFLGQRTPPQSEERAKVPYVCSLKWALQQQNSFGQSDTIEGISRAFEIRRYYRTLLIQEFDLSSLNPRIQQALLYLLQDREAAGLLTILHITDYNPQLVGDSQLVDFLKTRCKVV